MKRRVIDSELKDKVVLITGSSMGIGKAIALALGRQGAVIVLNGRNLDRLQATADELIAEDIQVLAVRADVSDPEDATYLVNRVISEYGTLDMLINNAGVSMRGCFESLQNDVVQQVIGSNLLGAIYMTRAALPHIRSTKGHVIFISSLAGIRGLPWVSVYGAAKMALTGLAESLRLEVDGTGIHVGIVYVGITQNEAEKRVLNAEGELIPLKWGGIRKGQTRAQVADSVLKMIRKRKFKSVLTGLGLFEAYANRMAPSVVEQILRNADKVAEERFQ